MISNFIKFFFSALILLCSLFPSAQAGKILEFSSSEQDLVTGKQIIRMIREASPNYFVPNAEDLTNKQGKIAYTLTSNGQGQSNIVSSSVSFNYTSVNMQEGYTETSPIYIGKGFSMVLHLKMSHRLLTGEGKKFFLDLAKKQSGIR